MDSFFQDLKTSSFDVLEQASNRTECPQCKRMRKFFCYDCLEWLVDETKVPKVALPVHIHIVRHAGESRSKSSIIPLKLICQDDVSLYETYANHSNPLPEVGPSDTVILFPSDDSVSVDEVDWEQINNVVVVDSTWTQTKAVLADLDHTRFKKVRLSSEYKTQFWRYQTGKGDDCLATVEAIYLLMRDAYQKDANLHLDLDTINPAHQFDEMLWFYKFNHNIVKTHSTSKRLPKRS